MRNALSLFGWLAVSFTASAIGAIASVNARTFYQQLDRPSWAPPGSIFGPVWTFLFALMGIAAWLIWRERESKQTGAALTIFLVQLMVNALWSWLFFAWKKGSLAIIDVIVLAVLIVATIAMFWRVRPLAAILLVPYLLWVSYAAALTYAVVQRNPEALS
jgi:tryptophan-rich sensory protein